MTDTQNNIVPIAPFLKPLHRERNGRQRNYTNPLRRLGMERVVQLLEAGERGDTSDLQWLYRHIEKRDSTLKGLKLRRLTALQKLDWDIKITDRLPAGITPEMAQAQADSLQALYDGIENLPDAIEHMALASFRGYSHLEKRYYANVPTQRIIRLEPVEQWFVVRNPKTWDWVYDPEARGSFSTGTVINPRHFVIRELDDPINEIGLIAYIRKNLSQKSWDEFVEDFGIPSIFGVLAPNTPPDQVEQWLKVIEQVTSNSRGSLPPGTDLKHVALGHQGEVPFKSHKDEMREEVVLAGTGGLLAMLTAPTGLNSEQAKVHDQAFDAIAQAEAAVISALFQTQIDRLHLAREFPGRPPVAYFELAAEEEESLDAQADLLVKLSTAGFEADEAEVSEKFGFKLRRRAPTPPAGFSMGGGVFANRATDPAAVDVVREERFLAAAADTLAEADQQVLAPIIARIEQLLAIEDDAQFAVALERLRADLPELEKQCLGNKASAALETAFENILATAFANGVSERSAASPKQSQNAP